MSEKPDPALTAVKIGPGRMSFPALFDPKTNEQGVEKYEITVLLPPGYNTAPLEQALWAAWHAKYGKDQKKWPKGPTVRTPDKVIRDATEKSHLAGYEEGWKFVSLRSDNPPGVVDAVVEDVTDKREVYPGRWCRVSGNAYVYTKPTVGVTFGLNNVQLLKNDTPFGGVAPKPKQDFDEYVEEDDPTA